MCEGGTPSSTNPEGVSVNSRTRDRSSWILLVSAAFLLVGCSSYTEAIYTSPDRDAEAKMFRVDPARATLYVVRDQMYLGDERLEVVVNEDSSAWTRGMTYFVTRVAPGRSVVTARGDKHVSLDVYADPGRLYFVQIEVRPSVYTLHATPRLVDDSTGMEAVRSCRRVEVE